MNSVDAKLWINDSGRIAGWTHFARSGRMINGGRVVPDETPPIIVCPQFVALATGKWSVVEFGAQFLKCFRFSQGQTDFRPLDNDVEILNVAEILRIDQRFGVGVG